MENKIEWNSIFPSTIEKTNDAKSAQSNEMSGFPPNLNSSNSSGCDTVSLLDLPPGDVKFCDLAEKMSPVTVEGLEHIKGVLGYVRNEEGHSVDESDNSHVHNKAGKPLEGALLWVNFSYYLEGSKTPFESNKLKGKPHMLTLNLEETLPGVLVACRWLRPGQRGQFLLPPDTMYGEAGCWPHVPKSTRIYLILQSIRWIDLGAVDRYLQLDESKQKDFNTISNLIVNTNEVAADFFKRKNYVKCLSVYESLDNMLKNCEIKSDNFVEINSRKIKTYINMAICHNLLLKPCFAINFLDEASVLGDWKKNCKYLFTRGKCHVLMEQYEEAQKFFIMALDLEPNNVEIGDELYKMDNMLLTHKNNESSLVKNMFSPYKKESESCDESDNIVKSVKDFGENLKNTNMTSFPLPPLLVHEEIKLLEDIVKEIEYLKIDPPSSETNGNVQKQFTVLRNNRF